VRNVGPPPPIRIAWRVSGVQSAGVSEQVRRALSAGAASVSEWVGYERVLSAQGGISARGHDGFLR
jgi:hypothetical protein